MQNELPVAIAKTLSTSKAIRKFLDTSRKVRSNELPAKERERYYLRLELQNVFYSVVSDLAAEVHLALGQEGRPSYKAVNGLPRDISLVTASMETIRDPSNDAMVAVPAEIRQRLLEALTWFDGMAEIIQNADLAEIERKATHLDEIEFDATPRAVEAARTIFRDATRKAFENIHGTYAARYLSAMKIYAAASDLVEGALAPYRIQYVEGFEKTLSHEIHAMYRIVGGLGERLTHDKLSDRIERAATLDAERARKGYVERNAAKLAPVLDKLGMTPEVDVETPHTTALLERTMRFVFVDGTRFIMTTSAEDVVNSHGTYFMRFPCRFSEVYDAKGSKLSVPSAAKVADAFGKKKRK